MDENCYAIMAEHRLSRLIGDGYPVETHSTRFTDWSQTAADASAETFLHASQIYHTDS